MPFNNAGPSNEVTVNTIPPRSTFQFVQTIGVTMTPTAVAANTSAEQSFGLNGSVVTAATGILPGDVILQVSGPSLVAGIITGASARVDTSVADKFYVHFGNLTTGALTPPAGVWLITVGRYITSTSGTPQTLSTLPNSITLN